MEKNMFITGGEDSDWRKGWDTGCAGLATCGSHAFKGRESVHVSLSSHMSHGYKTHLQVLIHSFDSFIRKAPSIMEFDYNFDWGESEDELTFGETVPQVETLRDENQSSTVSSSSQSHSEDEDQDDEYASLVFTGDKKADFKTLEGYLKRRRSDVLIKCPICEATFSKNSKRRRHLLGCSYRAAVCGPLKGRKRKTTTTWLSEGEEDQDSESGVRKRICVRRAHAVAACFACIS